MTSQSSETLGVLLSEGQIIPNMLATERWQAIEEIVSFLAEGGHLPKKEKENILAALFHREETMSTGIGFGVAIPHASSEAVDKIIVAFGRSQTGIEFESLDDKPVHFVVLFLVPSDQFQTHLKTLSAIAKFLNDRVTREALTNAHDAKDIMQILLREK
ncbi:MAG: PTS sugar transporter subunit IIA [Chthoniobacterales bacterium]|nr:PTS sugar transporter subunit IIA [Chthoniobacterales bacterium]